MPGCFTLLLRKTKMAKRSFLRKKQILINKFVNVNKRRLFKAYVWSLLLYGCKS